MVNTYLVLFVSGFWFCGRTMARPYIIFLYGLRGHGTPCPYWVVFVLLFIFVGTRHDASVIVLVSVIADASCCVPTFILYVYRTRHAVSLLGCFLFDRLFFISRFFVGT